MARNTMSSVLTEFALTMVTDFPITKILDHLVQRIVEVLPVTSAGVTLITQGEDPRYIAASDKNALRFEQLQSEMGEGPCLLSYQSGNPVSVPDLEHDERFAAFAPAAVEAGLAAVFAFPLRHGAGRFGALDLYRSTAGPLDPEAMASAVTLANVAAVYLINAESRDATAARAQEMHDLATHDVLTGLPNMLLLRQRLEHTAQRARRTGAPAAILFIDLDRFKSVNDMHGHQVGDLLLVAIAERLSTVVRPGDTLARIYGDEFVLLCEDLHTRADVDVLVSRIRGVFDVPFQVEDLTLKASASVGIGYSGPGEQVTEGLVTAADQAMYKVKQGGDRGRAVDVRDVPRQKDPT
jgi:diguanylate cyclase (GGDEF)-like protein